MNRLTGPLAMLACVLIGSQAPAQSEVERRAFQEARSLSTAKGWEAFLDAHPKSKLVQKARESLDLELNDLALQTIRSSKGVAGQEARLSAVAAAKAIARLYRRCRTPDGSDRLFLLWDDATYAAAVATGRVEDFRAYLLRFPEGKNSKRVQPAIEAGAWKRCQAANTVVAYRQFLAEFGRGMHAIKARLAISRLQFEEACKADTIEGYELFLQGHMRHEGATLRLAALMYRGASESGELREWRAFRKRFLPKAYRSRSLANTNEVLRRMLADSAREIERLLFAEITTAPTVEACEEYLKEYPKGTHRAQVMLQKEDCLFEQVINKGTVQACIDYLKKYRKSDRIVEVIFRLDRLIFRKLPPEEQFKDLSAYIALFPRQRTSLVAKMEPYMYDWAKRVASEASYQTYLRWQSRSQHWVPGTPSKTKPGEIALNPRVAEIKILLEPFLWKKIRAADWHEQYEGYLIRYPQGSHIKQAKERLQFLSTQKAIPKLLAPTTVHRIANKWKWTTRFSETGGKVGYKLTGMGWIYSKSGKKYGIKQGYTRPSIRPLNRGSITVKPSGKATKAYWLRGNFVGGHVTFTWTGKDAGGHKIRLIERVQLEL